MHGASDATKGDSIDPNQRLPRFLSELERIVNLMLLCSEIRAKDKSLPLTGLPMMWTFGHLLHGSGFTAQVLAERKSTYAAVRGYPKQIASGSLLQVLTVNPCTGKRVHISQGERPSTSAATTGRQSCSPTGRFVEEYPTIDQRLELIRAWQKCLRHAMNYGFVPSSPKMH